MAETIPRLMLEITGRYPDHVAQYSKDASGVFQPTTFVQLAEEVRQFAGGLLARGVNRGDHVGLISDNRKEWLIVDLAVLSIGASDVPRGNDAVEVELRYILGFSECKVVCVENLEQYRKLLAILSELPLVERIIVLDGTYSLEKKEKLPRPLTVENFDQVMKTGADFNRKEPDRVRAEIEKGEGNDVATMIFTSGTTGEPKGVMLSHRNFLHQVESVPLLITAGPGDRWLSVLPVWHSFERIMQYVALGIASAICYSKPIAKIIGEDLMKVKPTWMASVPRIWESLRSTIYRSVKSEGGVKKALFLFFVAVCSVHEAASQRVHGYTPRFRKYPRILDLLIGVWPFVFLYPLRALGNLLVFKKIHEKLGGEFVAGISGGGALPSAVDTFFGAASVLLLEGYGLTETAPVIALRLQRHPVPGTVGPAFPGTEIKIVDEEGNELPRGQQGVVVARGPQVMLGYYRKPNLTRQVLSEDGWLNTGDLGIMTHDGEIKITGRAKDTIVLLGGENVEPVPIEQKLKESEYIAEAVLLGQDQKFLAALIVPDIEALKRFAEENNVTYSSGEELTESPEVEKLINDEISGLVCRKNGFKPFERVFRFILLPRPFELGNELSAKQEIKRHVITKLYARQIERLFAQRSVGAASK